MEKTSKYITMWKAMKAERATTESEWQRVADYSFPKRDFTTTRTPGTNRMQRIFDSTGVSSVLLLASALHGNLTPVQTKWLFLKSSIETRPYFDMATEKMVALFASPSSMFAAQAHEFYMDIVAFGNAVMAIHNKNGRITFKTLNLADCWFKENIYGVVDTLVYCQKYTPQQMIERFGEESVHSAVKEELEKDGEKKKFTVMNYVEPRAENRGRGAEKKLKPFKSVYIDVDNSHELLEDGFDDFPYVVARFSKRSGETYGYGPGMSSFSEVRMLNEIVEVMLRAATKNADPPILSPIDGVILPMRLDPSGINYYDPDTGPPEFWSNGFRPDYMDNLIERKRLDVQRMFFIDFLTLPDKSRMTATETMQHSQNNFRNMSAVNARLETEFLSKVVERVFNLMVDNGDLPVPPNEAQGQDIVIEYTSPMAMAQKSISANSVLQGLSVVSQVAQYDPAVAQILNAPVIARDQLLNTFLMPSEYIKTEDEYDEIIEQQKEAQASAAMAQNMQGYASAAKDGADALTTLGEQQV
jgi:hypothetical protein